MYVPALEANELPSVVANDCLRDQPTAWRVGSPLSSLDPKLKLMMAGGLPRWAGREIFMLALEGSDVVAVAYDPVANKWRRLPALPEGGTKDLENGAKSFWTGDKWLLFAASRGWVFDAKTETWARLPPPPGDARWYASVTYVPSTQELLYSGAITQEQQGGYVMDPGGFARRLDNGAVRAVSPSPLTGRSGVPVMWDGRRAIFVFGLDVRCYGDECGTLGGAAAWDPVTDAWESLPEPPVKSRLVGNLGDATAEGGRSFFFGGPSMASATDVSSSCADGAAWDPETNRWLALSHHPFISEARCRYATWTAKDRFFLWGSGVNVNGAIYEFPTGTWSLMEDAPTALPGARPVVTECGTVLIGPEGVLIYRD